MANAAALIDESLWRRDRDFQQLPRLAQCTFLQLLSTKDVDCAGVLTLNVDVLAKGCDELTLEQLWHDLKTLEQARFVFVDTDTDELLIRSYARRVSARSPNAYKAALRVAKLVASPKLRFELANELRRINRVDATKVAEEIMPDETPSEPHPDTIRTPSERGIPSEPHPNPPASVPVPVDLSSVDGQVGGSCTRATGATAESELGDEPPPIRCDRHKNRTDDPPCRDCRAARERREAWDVEQAQRHVRERADFWAAVRACPWCDERGLIDGGDELTRCTAHDWGLIHA